jgi:hypothetical protein
VSHGQGALVEKLLQDIARLSETDIEVILTINVPETLNFSPETVGVPVRVLRNSRPKGFGQNHNTAFLASDREFFCVANPDIRLQGNPFPPLIRRLHDSGVGLAAPLVINPQGGIEDSARRFPTARSLLKKLVSKIAGWSGTPDYPPSQAVHPDWVAGMFMLFRRDTFAEVHGFDERYFLYYEDVDLCARLRLLRKRIVLDPASTVIHAARRTSHHHLQYAAWHARSVARYLRSATYRELRRTGLV